MADMQLVLSIFDDEAAADSAAESLKNWNGYSFEMKMGPIGVLVLDEKGHIKEHKLGPRSTGTGAGIGLVLAVIAPPSLLVGLVGGGAIGHFRHKGLGLDQADRDRIIAELAGGKAAVGVMALPQQAQVISETLADLGGTPEVYDVSGDALDAVASAAPADADGGEATGAAPTA
ncbi:MAG TPA: hypothetical protein VGQ31_04685 [Candidatus Limnocylindrales bacterium]|jgi:hypothetical protein|nr:hypothetical protein [Candidatus Limnocylindrales bacterium]